VPARQLAASSVASKPRATCPSPSAGSSADRDQGRRP
jgi:hypothetical protein